MGGCLGLGGLGGLGTGHRGSSVCSSFSDDPGTSLSFPGSCLCRIRAAFLPVAVAGFWSFPARRQARSKPTPPGPSRPCAEPRGPRRPRPSADREGPRAAQPTRPGPRSRALGGAHKASPGPPRPHSAPHLCPPPPPAVSPADLRPDAAGRGLRRGRLPGGGRGAGRGLPRGPHRSLVHPSPQAAHFPHLARGDPQPAGSRGHTRHKPPEVGPACWGPGGNRSPAAGIRSSPRARRAGHRKGGTEPQKGAAAAGGAGPRGPASDPARLPGAGAANCRNLCSLDNWGVMDTALGGFTLVEIHNKLGFASACQRCPGVAGRLAAGGTSETSGQDLQGRLYRSAPGRNPETSSQAQYPNSVNGPAITTCAVARVGV